MQLSMRDRAQVDREDISGVMLRGVERGASVFGRASSWIRAPRRWSAGLRRAVAQRQLALGQGPAVDRDVARSEL
jgi:hypothetical protein